MDKIQSYKKLVRNLRLEKEKNESLIRTRNYTQSNIREFTTDHTIYLGKLVKGYSHFILCKFVKFEKGIVTGIPIAVEPDWASRIYFDVFNKPIKPITARLNKCCLRDATGVCYWFNNEGFVK